MKKAAANPRRPGWCYLGEYPYTVDAQRRVAIPSGWRAESRGGDHFVLLPGRDRALLLVPAATFDALIAKLRTVSFADAQAGVALASIGALAADCRTDGQGRITLTPELMAHAGIGDRAVLVGAFTTIQVWEPESWRRRRMDSGRSLDVIQALQERPDDLARVLRGIVGTAAEP